MAFAWESERDCCQSLLRVFDNIRVGCIFGMLSGMVKGLDKLFKFCINNILFNWKFPLKHFQKCGLFF